MTHDCLETTYRANIDREQQPSRVFGLRRRGTMRITHLDLFDFQTRGYTVRRRPTILRFTAHFCAPPTSSHFSFLLSIWHAFPCGGPEFAAPLFAHPGQSARVPGHGFMRTRPRSVGKMSDLPNRYITLLIHVSSSLPLLSFPARSTPYPTPV